MIPGSDLVARCALTSAAIGLSNGAMEPLVAIQLLTPVVAQLRRTGHDADAFVRELGVDPAALDDRTARVPLSAVVGVTERAAELAGDPYFGLHAGEQVDERSFDVVSYAAAACATLRGALETTIRYFRLLAEARTFSLETEGGEARLSTRLALPEGRHATELVLALNHALARRLTAGPWALREVWLTHAAPARTAEHARFFEAPLRFDAPVDALVFDAALLDLPLRTADPTLAAILRGVADDLLEELATDGSAALEVRRRLPELIRSGDAGVEATARAMATSARTLQRRLRDEGTNHRALLDEVRHQLAVRYLARPELSAAEVGFLLGFADPASFHRAFKRWTGTTPAEHRRG